MSHLHRVVGFSGMGLSACLLGLAKALYVICGIFFVGFLGSGFWELVVWLFRTGWRNSGFEVPVLLLLFSLVIGFGAYLSYLLGRGFRATSGEKVKIDSAVYYLMVAAAGVLILVTGWLIVVHG